MLSINFQKYTLWGTILSNPAWCKHNMSILCIVQLELKCSVFDLLSFAGDSQLAQNVNLSLLSIMTFHKTRYILERWINLKHTLLSGRKCLCLPMESLTCFLKVNLYAFNNCFDWLFLHVTLVYSACFIWRIPKILNKGLSNLNSYLLWYNYGYLRGQGEREIVKEKWNIWGYENGQTIIINQRTLPKTVSCGVLLNRFFW